MTPVDLVWESVKDHCFCAREEYEAALADWELHPIYRCGELSGVVMLRGNEIHCAAHPKYRGRWGFRDALAFVRPGQVTRTGKTNTIARRFLERLGFLLSHEDTFDAHYALPQDLSLPLAFARPRRRIPDR